MPRWPQPADQATLSLPAGHYYFCTQDTGSQEHADHGMFGELDVTGDSGAALPTATAQIQASVDKSAISGLKAGANLVKFTNDGRQLPNAVAWPILPGKALDDVKAAFASHDDNAPLPVDFATASAPQPSTLARPPWCAGRRRAATTPWSASRPAATAARRASSSSISHDPCTAAMPRYRGAPDGPEAGSPEPPGGHSRLNGSKGKDGIDNG